MIPLRKAAMCAALVGVLFGGCAATAPQTASDVLLRMADSTLRQAEAARGVQLEVTPQTVAIGQTLALAVRSKEAGYAYVYQIGSDGQTLSLVFPNAHDGANYVAAGGVLTLPRPGWRLSSKGPAGLGYMVAVVAQRQQDLMATTQAVAEQRIAVQGSYGATMVSFREVAP